MKRRYLAIMMGLTLAAASASALAQETELSEVETQEILVAVENVEDNESEDVDKSTENQQYWGKVITIDENEITIALGTIEAQENAEISDEETAEQENVYELFEATGEEITIPITEDTEIYFVYGNADIAYLELEPGVAEELLIEKTEQAAEEEVNVAGTEAVNAEEVNVAGTEAVNAEEADAAGTEAVNAEEADAAETEAVNLEEVNAAGTEAVNAEEAADSARIEGTEEKETVNAAENEDIDALTIKIESAELADILTDDLVKITLDEDGNAAVILIAMAHA